MLLYSYIEMYNVCIVHISTVLLSELWKRLNKCHYQGGHFGQVPGALRFWKPSKFSGPFVLILTMRDCTFLGGIYVAGLWGSVNTGNRVSVCTHIPRDEIPISIKLSKITCTL